MLWSQYHNNDGQEGIPLMCEKQLLLDPAHARTRQQAQTSTQGRSAMYQNRSSPRPTKAITL